MSPSGDFVVEEGEGTLVITLGPRVSALDNTSLLERRSALAEAIQSTTASAVIIDFSQVGYFGSLLLDTLCVLWKQVRERSGAMALCNLSEVSKEILTRSKLNSLWPIYSSRHDAIQGLQHATQRAQARPKFDPSADSRVVHKSADPTPSRLRIHSTGHRTVVGFAGGDLPPEHVLSRYLAQITGLIDQHACREFAFDMAGVSTVPSGFLAVVTSILNKGVEVAIINSSTEIREVLALTNFDRRVRVDESDRAV